MSNANIGQNDALAYSKVNTSQTTKQRPRGPQNKEPADHKGNEPEATNLTYGYWHYPYAHRGKAGIRL